MKHYWNDTDRGKLKHSEKPCHSATFVHHRSHVYWPGIQLGPPRSEVGDNHLSHGSLQRCEYGLSFGLKFAPGTTLIRNMSDAHWTEGLSLKSVPNTSYYNTTNGKGT